MGRRSKAGLVVSRARRIPAGEEVRLSDPRLQRLGARFKQIRQQVARTTVDASIEAGDVLEEGKKLLVQPASYNRWVKALGTSRDTADNYTNLARLDRESPGLVEQWKELGPTKLYRLARMTPKERHDILKTPKLLEMTDAQFAELTSGEPSKDATPNMIGHGLFEKAKGMETRLALIELPAIDDPEVRQRLKQKLLDLAKLARELAMKIG